MANEDNFLNFGEEKNAVTTSTQIVSNTVSDRDIFQLAQNILISAVLLYLILAVLTMIWGWNSTKYDIVKEIWDYSKVFINSIISLVLGLYFGNKVQTKSTV